MEFLEMIVAVVALKSGADLLKSLATRQERKADDKLVAEVESLRSEVKKLHQQHQDTILSFDGTLDRFDRRVDRLETRSELPSEHSAGAERFPERETMSTVRTGR